MVYSYLLDTVLSDFTKQNFSGHLKNSSQIIIEFGVRTASYSGGRDPYFLLNFKLARHFISKPGYKSSVSYNTLELRGEVIRKSLHLLYDIKLIFSKSEIMMQGARTWGSDAVWSPAVPEGWNSRPWLISSPPIASYITFRVVLPLRSDP